MTDETATPDEVVSAGAIGSSAAESSAAEPLCRRCGQELIVLRDHEPDDVPATMICDTCCEGYNALAEALATEYINEDAMAAGMEAERQAQAQARAEAEAAAAAGAETDATEADAHEEPEDAAPPEDDKRFSRGDIFGSIVKNVRERTDQARRG